MSDFETAKQPRITTANLSLERYIERHPAAASARLAEFPLSEINELFGQLSASGCAKLLASLPDSLSDQLIRSAQIDRLAGWLTQAHPDDASAIAGRISLRQRRRLIAAGTDNRILVERLSKTSTSDIASLLQVDFLRVGQDATLDELIAELKQRKRTAHRSIFVVDSSGRYKGIIELSKALTAEPHRKARDLLRPAQPVLITDTLAQALRHTSWNHYRELPVVDEQHRLMASLLWGDLQHQLSKNAPAQNGDAHLDGFFQQGLELTTKMMTTLVDTLAALGRNS